MKLNLGCENKLLEGFVNVDRDLGSGADVYWDLNKRFPIKAGVVDEIFAFDILEHLDCPVVFLNECWRVLELGGVLWVHVPHFKDGSAYFPEHKTLFSYAWFEKGLEKKYVGIKPFESEIRLRYKKGITTPLDWVANIHPRMWERLFWVTGIDVKLTKIKEV